MGRNDSSVPPSPVRAFGQGQKMGSSTYLSSMNSSQSSLHNSQSSLHNDIEEPRRPLDASHMPQRSMANGTKITGASPAVQAPDSASQPQVPTNLSGLVCNVHRTTGREPHALVGATTTVLGDKLYVFGGRVLSRTRPQLTSDLYELDLVRRHWTKLETTGDIPPPRYFHSVCPLGDTKLVCYGGMSPRTGLSTASNPSQQNGAQDNQPEVAVMSDIHIYDVLTREWTNIQTAETPQGRYAHCANILPSSATFSSATAPMSAIHHNPSSTNPHQGTLGVALDGTGGAEMVVVGGQDSNNNYIEQINVFNLRSLRWTATNSLGRSCGAYRSVVAPLAGISVSDIGAGTKSSRSEHKPVEQEKGSSMLIYSNYNFMDVKLELQVRMPDGSLSEKSMHGPISPPGLRFPNGGVVDGHFVVSGTYLTSSKQEYALWALDLRTLTWGRIDAGGAVFSQGSWNRGVLWNRRNTFVILGNRKRSLVEDYNHRRINFSHICMVELEAFGLYDNPRWTAPTSEYVSVSAPPILPSIQMRSAYQYGGGRPYSTAAQELGQMALGLREFADMDLVARGGEKTPVNSHLLARRWGPYFNQLLRQATSNSEGLDPSTLHPGAAHPSRNSSITITPSVNTAMSNATTLGGKQDNTSNYDPPEPHKVSPTSRPRALYLPHMHGTIQTLVLYLYTSALPPVSSPLSTVQILCSLLQLARPYQVDGLLEATVERLHEVMDGRNAAAVFNAAAMAAGGGRTLGFGNYSGGTLETLKQAHNAFSPPGSQSSNLNGKPMPLRVQTNFSYTNPQKDDELSSASTGTSGVTGSDYQGGDGDRREVWSGDHSSVIGLQKRGLRGLMEGKRMRDRGKSVGQPGHEQENGKSGLGIA